MSGGNHTWRVGPVSPGKAAVAEAFVDSAPGAVRWPERSGRHELETLGQPTRDARTAIGPSDEELFRELWLISHFGWIADATISRALIISGAQGHPRRWCGGPSAGTGEPWVGRAAPQRWRNRGARVASDRQRSRRPGASRLNCRPAAHGADRINRVSRSYFPSSSQRPAMIRRRARHGGVSAGASREPTSLRSPLAEV